MKPLNLVINKNDRRDALLGMGVSPGQDESYDEQAKRLMAQKSVIARDRRNVLERLDAMIQTNRSKRSAEGTWSPSEFAIETLAKTIPTPSEVNPINVIKGIPELAKGAVEVARHPLATLKQLALNPPEATTVASMMLPGAALKAYRELTPLAARTYIHHMAGVPTPFSHVTGKEREALTTFAQERIDELLAKQEKYQRVRSYALKNMNEIKLMNRADLLAHFEDEGLDIDVSDFFRKTTPQLRDIAVEHYKMNRPSIFKRTPDEMKYLLDLGDEADNANVREDFKKITGKQLKGFQVNPLFAGSSDIDLSTALGKTYVEPMIDKATGKVIPKAIKDTYKFYPDVYGYDKGQARKETLDALDMYIKGHFQGGGNITNIPFKQLKNILFDMSSNNPLGIAARKLGMKRPTSIIDIPLTKAPPMNAYDKAAILMGAKAAAAEKRK